MGFSSNSQTNTIITNFYAWKKHSLQLIEIKPLALFESLIFDVDLMEYTLSLSAESFYLSQQAFSSSKLMVARVCALGTLWNNFQ